MCLSPLAVSLPENYLLKNGTSDVLLCGNSSDAGYVVPTPRATSPSPGGLPVLAQLAMLSGFALDPRDSKASTPEETTLKGRADPQGVKPPGRQDRTGGQPQRLCRPSH